MRTKRVRVADELYRMLEEERKMLELHTKEDKSLCDASKILAGKLSGVKVNISVKKPCRRRRKWEVEFYPNYKYGK